MPVKETEADSRYVVGCASMEPTNTSYPNATHTPNVSKPDNVNRRTIQFPEGKELLETDKTEPKPHKRENNRATDDSLREKKNRVAGKLAGKFSRRRTGGRAGTRTPSTMHHHPLDRSPSHPI
ncbi:unnamed protein product, partial [Microthlaspi erraticum]